MWNGFYSLKLLDDNQLKKLFYRSIELSDDYYIEILVKYTRERYDKITYQEYIEKYVNTKSYNVVINRQVYTNFESDDFIFGEIKSCTLGKISGDLFLFIYVSLENLEIIINEFDLYPLV